MCLIYSIKYVCKVPLEQYSWLYKLDQMSLNDNASTDSPDQFTDLLSEDDYYIDEVVSIYGVARK